MISIRTSEQRGHFNHGWLDTHHTFSFGDYYDPDYTSFSSLRVINEDSVAPDRGFPTHSHRDMEIITYVLEGELQHKDSMGNSSIIRPGEVQRMSAGTGVSHSEFNPSKTEPVHFLQIWISPDQYNVEPGYAQKSFAGAVAQGGLQLVASKDGRAGSVTIHQDAAIHVARLQPGESISHTPSANRHTYLQVARGSIDVNGQSLKQGDGARISEETDIQVQAINGAGAELLLFDLS